MYGSLRRGERHADLVDDLPRRPGLVRGRLWLAPDGYAVLVTDPEGPPIVGELVGEVDAARLSALDEFEGLSRGLYQREQVAVLLAEGVVPALAYTLPDVVVRQRAYRPTSLLDWAQRPPALRP